MATIYPKRKDGKIVSFKFKTFLGRDENGKQQFKCKTWIPDKQMAENRLLALAEKESIIWERQVQVDMEEQKNTFKPVEITFERFVKDVWQPAKMNLNEVRPTTIAFNNYILKIIIPYFDKLKLSEITSKTIEQYLDYLRNSYRSKNGKGLAPKTVKHHYCLLNLIFQYAFKLDYIDNNPLTKVDTPKLIKHRVDALTKDQVKTFIEELKTIPLMQRTMYTLLLTTGIRRGEMFGLKWKDIDFNNRLIRIERNVIYTKESGVIVGLPKTTAGIRDIPITDGMIRLLNEYKQGEKVFDNAFVFHTDNEPFKPHNPDYATRYLRKFMQRANLPNMSPHDLRHTCASMLLQSGADIKSVQDILGHADASTTLNFYVKSDMQNMRLSTDRAFNF